MAERPDITLDDLKTLTRGQAPDLAQAIVHFAAQPQPEFKTVPEAALIAEQFEAAAQRVTGLTINDAAPQVARGAELLAQVAALPRG